MFLANCVPVRPMVCPALAIACPGAAKASVGALGPKDPVARSTCDPIPFAYRGIFGISNSLTFSVYIDLEAQRSLVVVLCWLVGLLHQVVLCRQRCGTLKPLHCQRHAP